MSTRPLGFVWNVFFNHHSISMRPRATEGSVTFRYQNTEKLSHLQRPENKWWDKDGDLLQTTHNDSAFNTLEYNSYLYFPCHHNGSPKEQATYKWQCNKAGNGNRVQGKKSHVDEGDVERFHG